MQAVVTSTVTHRGLWGQVFGRQRVDLCPLCDSQAPTITKFITRTLRNVGGIAAPGQ